MNLAELITWGAFGVVVWATLHLVRHAFVPIPDFIQRAPMFGCPRQHAKLGLFTLVSWGGGLPARKRFALRQPPNGDWGEWTEYLARRKETAKMDFRTWVNERQPGLKAALGNVQDKSNKDLLGNILPIRDMDKYRRHMDPDREPCDGV